MRVYTVSQYHTYNCFNNIFNRDVVKTGSGKTKVKTKMHSFRHTFTFIIIIIIIIILYKSKIYHHCIQHIQELQTAEITRNIPFRKKNIMPWKTYPLLLTP